MRSFLIVTCYRIIGVVIEQDKMAGVCDACGRTDKWVQNLGRKNEQTKFVGSLLAYLGADLRILTKQDGRIWAGFVWFREGRSTGLLLTRQ